jgi:hypothetical protein
LGYLPTASVGLFCDFLPSPPFCKPFFQFCRRGQRALVGVPQCGLERLAMTGAHRKLLALLPDEK